MKPHLLPSALALLVAGICFPPAVAEGTVPLFDGSDTRRWYAFVKDVGTPIAFCNVVLKPQ